jgi:uncharacterized protein (TIGR03437 family)
MKGILGFLLSAAAVLAQTSNIDFIDGQAARLVIGQPTFTSQDSNSSDTILGAASGLAFAGDTLFVADSNRVGATPSNHRVLLFQNVSGQFPNPAAQLTYDRKCPVCLGQASVVLGQPDFTTTTENTAASRNNLRLPTAVASDGVRLVVADTNHNRILIWNRIPTSNNTPADVVVGQKDFTSYAVPGNTPNASSMRGPQGVWIQNGKLYVADTQNNRVLIFNHIPASNGAAADVVLGQPNMTTFVQPDLTQQQLDVNAKRLLNPVAVSSDGIRLFVTDLGYNRVLIWNSIPTTNEQPADIALGQPDLNSSVANYGFTVDSNDTATPQKEIPVLCPDSNGKDANDSPTYPASCKATLSFPRFALAAGNRLFIADGGNDRILVYESMPTQSGQSADLVIGQIGGSINQASDAADSLRTPMSLAWDGTNLYVSDAYNRRITVYSIGANTIPYTGVRNAASLDILARGTVTFTGDIQAGDSVTVNVGGTTTTDSSGTETTTGGVDYKYTVVTDDTLTKIIETLASQMNGSNSGAGDPNVYATPDSAIGALLLTSRLSGAAGNDITLHVTVAKASSASSALLVAAASGSTLSGGGDAAKIAPGSLVSILGANLSGTTASADLGQETLPSELGGTQAYFNGIAAPMVFVSPDRVTAQIPWELLDTTSINAYVRSVRDDGSVVVTTPVAVTIVPANPGIYARPNTTPSVGLTYHGSSSATGVVSVDGTATANDTATVTIEDRSYTYTVASGDTLDSIRDALVSLINQDPKVSAEASGVFDRILLRARVQGPEGNSITYGASASATASVIMTAIGGTMCCANVEGSPVTMSNPAMPGEVLVVYATGLGLPVLNDSNKDFLSTGRQWPKDGPVVAPANPVNSIAGGKTADVISATLVPGQVGMYKVLLHLNPDLPSDPLAQLTIAQNEFVSNIVVLPIGIQSQDGTGSSTAPQFKAAAVTNPASFVSGMVAGSLATIFATGVRDADGSQVADRVPLPASLGGVSVTVDGIAAGVYSLSNVNGQQQLSFQVPWAIAGRTHAAVVITRDGQPSAAVDVPVVPAQPAAYTVEGTQGIVVHAADYTLATGARPLVRGEYAFAYASSLGSVSNQPADGAGGPASPLASVLADVRVTIGGVPCEVQFAGLAPGFVGVYQVNFRVPAAVSSGSQDLVIAAAGVASPTVKIPVE